MVNWNIIASIFIPNVGGWMSTLTMIGQVKKPDGNAWYQVIKKPSWTPPNWVFGPVWTTLYTAMGYASYLVYRDCGGFTQAALVPLSFYGGQLILNWTWTPIFFGLHLIRLGYFHMLALNSAATACTVTFFYVNKTAGCLMLPYLAWIAYATFLNRAIWKLNPHSGDDDNAVCVQDPSAEMSKTRDLEE